MEKKLIKPGFFAKEASADSRRVEFDILNEQYLHCKKKADVVFFGDSITHFWDLELYFNPAILESIVSIISLNFASFSCSSFTLLSGAFAKNPGFPSILSVISF